MHLWCAGGLHTVVEGVGLSVLRLYINFPARGMLVSSVVCSTSKGNAGWKLLSLLVYVLYHLLYQAGAAFCMLSLFKAICMLMFVICNQDPLIIRMTYFLHGIHCDLSISPLGALDARGSNPLPNYTSCGTLCKYEVLKFSAASSCFILRRIYSRAS